MTLNFEIADVIDFQSKIDEYQQLLDQITCNQKKLYSEAGKLFPKMDNSLFQQVLLLKRVEEHVQRISKLEEMLKRLS